MQNGSKKVIKIGFLLPIDKKWMGGVHYLKTLFRAIQYINEQNEDNIILQPYIVEPADKDLAEEFAQYANFIRVKRLRKSSYIFKKLYCVLTSKKFDKQKYIKEKFDCKIDIVSHSLSTLLVPMLPWIPDFQHIHLPEMFSNKEIETRNTSFANQIEKGKFVILSSKDAFKDFRTFSPDNTEKARVLRFVSYVAPEIYEQTDRMAETIKQKYDIPQKYFYLPNQFWVHKNHKIVFEAISILKKRGINVKIIFTGYNIDYRNKNYYAQLTDYVKKEQIKENIKILGLVDSLTVYYLMRNCVSVINPSLFEGWSSTVEEAKSLGKNIILSDLNVHREQNPPSAIYFNPNNAEELADILQQKWTSASGGPDKELETVARENMKSRMLDFGRTYKQIVMEAIKEV